MRRPWLIGGFCFTLMCWATDATSQSVDTKAPEEALSAMSGFLTAWLVEQDKDKTTAYFSGTARSQEVAPRAVWSIRTGSEELSPEQVDEYWKVLNRLGMPSGDSLRESLAPIDPDLKKQLRHFVSPVEHEHGEFTAFVASNAETINSFDGGYGNVVAVLQPSENRILTMIADFANRQTERYRGPFVSFWGEEYGEEESAWRIQALGAVPEVEAWLDGR